MAGKGAFFGRHQLKAAVMRGLKIGLRKAVTNPGLWGLFIPSFLVAGDGRRRRRDPDTAGLGYSTPEQMLRDCNATLRSRHLFDE
jgi:hypothetical protein